MKQFKKALSVFLQLVLILSAFSVLPVSAARLDESVQDSTAMGKDIQWIVDEAQLRDLAEICNNHEYANGVCKYCGVDGPVHSVKVQAENGTVTASKNSPRTSETVTLTLAPNSGYKLNSLTVTDEKGKAVAVNNNQFIMPDSNVTVKASFVFAPYIKGDANGDGVVNISDVTEIQRLLAKAKTDPDGMITLRANVTDGKLNIDDATAIQRYIAGYSKNPYHIGEKVEK